MKKNYEKITRKRSMGMIKQEKILVFNFNKVNYLYSKKPMSKGKILQTIKIDFIGIGAQRCGTTWISQCLKEHPQICFFSTKEGSFFNKENGDIHRYKAGFSHCKSYQIKGEYSPQYIHPEDDPQHEAPKRIKSMFPFVKLIVSLRNPIERASSQYALYRIKGKEKALTFGEAILRSEYKYIEAGFYFSFLKPYFKLFPHENILVLIYEDIKKDPLKFIQSIYRFLEVDDTFVPPSLKKEISIRQRIKIIILLDRLAVNLYSFFSKTPWGKILIKLLKIIKITRLLRYLEREFGWYYMPTPKTLKERITIRPEIRRFLQRIYSEEIKNLEKLINRDLSFWH